MTTEPQVRLAEIYPKPGPQSSGKRGNISAASSRSAALKLAADVARQLGMVRTWQNVQIIRLAIESEAEYSGITIPQAAALIAMAANDFTIVDPQRYSFQAAALLRKSNIVNRFWFEDALWRCKAAYDDMLVRLQRESA
jgi:hypothetical protein